MPSLSDSQAAETCHSAAASPLTMHSEGGKRRRKADRAFVFQNYPSRKIAIRLAYHGHVHDGLAKQAETDNTVEAIVVAALIRVRLVPESGPERLSRCGRTDKGVSALGNALSFIARASCWPTDSPQSPPLDYCYMLNNVLPPTVRVVGFALVDNDFDARFSCVSRTYRYYFCHRGLNLAAMREAAGHMLGTHSFRNLCKMDVVNVSNFERTVTALGIYESEHVPELISYLQIQANSFLYHQIRCTMEVLTLVGRGLESPNVVRALLERGDKKPQYPLADGTPLVLWDCGFTGLTWHISHRAFQAAERELQDIATALLIRSTAAQAMRGQLFAWYAESSDVCVDSTDVNGASVPQKVVTRRLRPQQQNNDDDGEQLELLSEAVVDSWSVTGCDWTEPRTHDNLKVRKYDLFNAVRHEDKLATATGEAKASGEAVAGTPRSASGLFSPSTTAGRSGSASAYVPQGYVPLLERETERTYAEEVAELAGKKRARYEMNERKKAAGAARIAMERPAQGQSADDGK